MPERSRTTSMSTERPGSARARPVALLARRSLLLLLVLGGARPALGQRLGSSRDSLFAPAPVAARVAAPASTRAATPAAAPAETSHPFLIHWNEYDLGFTTFLWGGAILTDYATYNQDSSSTAHFDLERQGKIRD